MEIALQILIAAIAAIGLGCILADVFKIPKYPVSKAITSLGKRKNKKTNPLDIWLGDLANLIASKLKLNEYKRLQLKIDLESADMTLSPEQYVANAIVKALFIGAFAIPFLFFAPIISAIVVAIAVVIYFSEYKKVGNVIKEKRRQIEAELPRLVSNIDKTLVHSRDVLGILDSYREHAGEELRRELDITVRSRRNDIAKEMHIAPSNFRWYAAYHNDEKHPHVHMLQGLCLYLPFCNQRLNHSSVLLRRQ